MKVGLNALFLDPGVSGGSETYLRALVPELVRGFPQTQFELVTTRRGARALVDDGWASLLPVVALPADDDERARRTVAELVRLPQLARSRGWDVVHSLSNRGPVRLDARSVLTVHDVIFFEHRTLGVVSTYGMRAATAAAARRADAIISVSSSAADSISEVLDIPRERITPILHGVGDPPGEAADGDEVRERHGIGEGRIVLCVGALRPHKNQALLAEILPDLPEDAEVVCVGHDEGYGAEIRAEAADARVAGRLHLTGRVDDAELEALWRMADCFALPTLAEGFGMPVLEALRRGVAVACSDLPVLREVAGGAARYFDPYDERSAARAVAAALADDGARGREHAARFTWAGTAAATHEVYERCTSG